MYEKLVALVKKFPGLNGIGLKGKGYRPKVHGSLKDAAREGLVYWDTRKGGWYAGERPSDLAIIAEAVLARPRDAERPVKATDLYCPDCGRRSLRLIEKVQASCDETKETRTCDRCANMVHLFRTKFGPADSG